MKAKPSNHFVVSHSKHKQENHNDISIIHVEKFKIKTIYFIILVGDDADAVAVHGRVMFTFSVLNVERNVSTSKAVGSIENADSFLS